MQNLLLYIKNKLNPIQAKILLNALSHSNNENFFNFVLENIELICTWLDSNEFKQKYEKLAYPPLINPEFIEIDASRHCAELAWDLNLPLPKHYKFIYISPHGVGAAAFLRYLNQCCNVKCIPSWILPADSKERYCIHHMCLINNANPQYAINIAEINLPDFDKFLALLDFNSKIICGVRDPIGILRHSWGRDWSKVLRDYPPEFNLTYDWRSYIEFLKPTNNELKIDKNELANSGFIIAYLLKRFNENNISYVDMEEIKPQKALNTMNSLSKKFSLTPPPKESLDLFKIKEFRGYIRYLFPITLYANSKDTSNIFHLKHPNNLKNPNIDPIDSIPIILDRKYLDPEKINFIEEIIQNDLSDDMGVYAYKNDFEKLKQNEPLFVSIKAYLYDFLCEIKKTIDETEIKMIKEEDVLAYFAKNKSLIPEFFKIFQDEFALLKQHRPDIAASWKYYGEFEKMI